MDELGQTSALPVWVQIMSALAGPTIAMIAVGYTALSYRSSLRFRAGDLAAEQIRMLDSDDQLAFACGAIDWGLGPLIVPQRFRPILEMVNKSRLGDAIEIDTHVIQHNPELMVRALRVRLQIDQNTEPVALIYRYCFDRLFSHLSNIYRLLNSGQIKRDDIGGLKYWLKRIAIYEYPPNNIDPKDVFQPFLEYEPFGYRSVIHLGEVLGVGDWSKSWLKQ